jgi:hypothetical protein
VSPVEYTGLLAEGSNVTVAQRAIVVIGRSYCALCIVIMLLLLQAPVIKVYVVEYDRGFFAFPVSGHDVKSAFSGLLG